MTRILRRVGIEAGLLLLGPVFGFWLVISVASYYDGASDAYWTANGHPPPPGLYGEPRHLNWVLLFGPYVAAVAVRGFLPAAKRFGVLKAWVG
jgi:hypothetical protein